MIWLALLNADAGACTPDALVAARDTISTIVDADSRRSKLASLLVEACTLKPRVSDMMALVPGASATDLTKYDLKAAQDDLDAWAGACPGGKATLDRASAQPGAARQRILWSECNVSRFKVGTENEWLEADAAIYLSILVGKHLEEQRVHESVSVPMLRALAGVGTAPAPAPTSIGPWAEARAAADSVASTYWDQLTEEQWKAKAVEFLGLCDSLRVRPPGERRDHRQVEFDVCMQAGRAAENANAAEAPLYREVGGTQVNWGFYIAALVAKGDPMVLKLLTDDQLKTSVTWTIGQIDAGKLPVTPP